MNRFDRITAILLQLQTKRLLTAQELADQFDVSLRTIYRDIRTLETAGVPIISEAGLGYFLDKGYKLPPVMFNQQEAFALFVAEKFIRDQADEDTKKAYKNALTKIKSVLNTQEKDHLESLNKRLDVQSYYHQTGRMKLNNQAPWLTDIQHALAKSQLLEIDYFTQYRQQNSSRIIEPIGLYFYSKHWHLIAWCRMRNDYRDFRLDRIQSLENKAEWFDQRSRGDLNTYLDRIRDQVKLFQAKVYFKNEVAPYTHEQRQWYGFISERETENQAIEMNFLTPSIEYFARWLLSYTDAVKIIEPPELKKTMKQLIRELNTVIDDE
mgnify:CR=1 FL=1